MEDQSEVLLVGPEAKKSPDWDRTKVLATAKLSHFKLMNLIFCLLINSFSALHGYLFI